MQPATTLPGTATARATTAHHTAAGQRRAAALGLLLCMALARPDPVLAQAETDDGSAVDWYGRPTLRLQQDLRDSLQELSRAAQSLRHLTDTLERHPEALLRGKPEEKP